jgi:UDP-3-O-[3-hydroxymyristoyl] glucosamine N-acyltransferase
VTIREGCILGDRVILHAGAVIGADGFGYATVEGVHHKIPQVGCVELGNDVEIGANTCIDRARFGKTVVGAGTKIDNLVQLAHNVQVGDHCIIIAQVGVAGSTRIGRHVTLCGQSAINGHISIGDRSIVTARAGVSKSLPPQSVVQGIPAQPMKQHQMQEIALRRLPRTQETVKQLQRRIVELEARLARLDGGGAA